MHGQRWHTARREEERLKKIVKGTHVQLTKDYKDHGDATKGPLQPGEVGVVIEVEHFCSRVSQSGKREPKSEPFHVRAANGKYMWYKAAAIEITSKKCEETPCQTTVTLSHNDPVLSVCFSPRGTKIVSGGGEPTYLDGNGDFSIRIWDTETGIQIGSPLTGHRYRQKL